MAHTCMRSLYRVAVAVPALALRPPWGDATPLHDAWLQYRPLTGTAPQHMCMCVCVCVYVRVYVCVYVGMCMCACVCV